MIAVLEADIFRLGAGFEYLGAAAEFKVFDERDGVAFNQDVTVGVLDDACGFRGGCLGPLVAAGGAFPVVGVAENIIDGAGGAGRVAHVEIDERV